MNSNGPAATRTLVAALATGLVVLGVAIFVLLARQPEPGGDNGSPSASLVAVGSASPASSIGPGGTPTSEPAATAAASGSPPATIAPSISPGIEPSPGTASPTAAPTTIPPGTPAASPSAPPEVGWIEVTEFPDYRGSARIESITAGGPGFVAVGSGGRQPHGRVWTSVDGINWTTAPDGPFAGHALSEVVRMNDSLFAFGRGPDGLRVWRSGDGRTWVGLAESPELRWAAVNDVAVVGKTMVAVGYVDDPEGEFGGAAWRSTDGVEWQRVASPEGLEELWSVAGMDGTLAGFARWPLLSPPLIVYSTDLGDTWQVAETDLGVTDEFNIGLVSVATNNARLVIVGYHELDEYVPISLTSRNGAQWRSVTLDAPPGFGLQQVVALRGGSFLALGSGDTAHVSRNGLDWRDVDPLPDYGTPPRPPEGGDEVVTDRQVAAGRSGVVVAEAWGDELRIWFAPLALFE